MNVLKSRPTNVIWMQLVQTLQVRMNANVELDIMDMDVLAQVYSISAKDPATSYKYKFLSVYFVRWSQAQQILSHNILTISDIDECSEGNFTCHPNATCINTQSSYNCQCKNGFEGDGKQNCTGIKLFMKTIDYFHGINHSMYLFLMTKILQIFRYWWMPWRKLHLPCKCNLHQYSRLIQLSMQNRIREGRRGELHRY